MTDSKSAKSAEFGLADLPEQIPIFPLSGVILLPRVHLPLNIFEPRYLVMLNDVLKTKNRLIGSIQPMEKGNEKSLHGVGCAGRVSGFSETSDNRYLITLTGVARFRLTKTVSGFTPYQKAKVDWSEFEGDLSSAANDLRFDREPFLDLFFKYMNLSESQYGLKKMRSIDAETLINTVSIVGQFDTMEKQALLESPSLAERRTALEALMRIAILKGGDRETMQ